MRDSTEAMVPPLAFKEFIFNSESPSRTTSIRPNSYPNSRAHAAAIASISAGRSSRDKL